MSTLQEDWNPATTWFFAVGLLEWQDSDAYPGFPEAVDNRADQQLVDLMRERGVPARQICYLQDAEATLENIQTKFVEMLERVGEDDLCIVYFTGHGDWDAETDEHYFVNYDADPEDYDTCWSVSGIIETIEENFGGAGVLLLADSCYSGGLIDAIEEQEPETSLACITSAYGHNTSTGQWTFTECLVKGFGGDASLDIDEDGEISLYDLSRYAELEMAFVEEQKSMFMTTGDFDPQMRITLTTTEADPVLDRRIEAQYEDEWFKAKTVEAGDDQTRVWFVIDNTEAWVDNANIRAYEPEQYTIGDAVSVESEEEEWLPATVKKAWYGLHYVSFDDYSDAYDEWVGPDRISEP